MMSARSPDVEGGLACSDVSMTGSTGATETRSTA